MSNTNSGVVNSFSIQPDDFRQIFMCGSSMMISAPLDKDHDVMRPQKVFEDQRTNIKYDLDVMPRDVKDSILADGFMLSEKSQNLACNFLIEKTVNEELAKLNPSLMMEAEQFSEFENAKGGKGFSKDDNEIYNVKDDWLTPSGF